MPHIVQDAVTQAVGSVKVSSNSNGSSQKNGNGDWKGILAWAVIAGLIITMLLSHIESSNANQRIMIENSNNQIIDLMKVMDKRVDKTEELGEESLKDRSAHSEAIESLKGEVKSNSDHIENFKDVRESIVQLRVIQSYQKGVLEGYAHRIEQNEAHSGVLGHPLMQTAGQDALKDRMSAVETEQRRRSTSKSWSHDHA